MKTISCMTLRSGKFVFSCDHDATLIREKQIEAQTLYNTVCDLPILPAMAAQLETELIRKSIFGTAAIEGNTLNEEEVQAVMDSPSREKLRSRSEKEVVRLQALYRALEKESRPDKSYTVRERTIKSIHKILTEGLDYHHNSPGKYRNEIVKVGDRNHGGEYTPPKILEDVKLLMRKFCAWINSDGMLDGDPMLRAGLAHYHLAKIHPFQDGNGRTARFLEALILARAGYKYLPPMMSNHYYKNIDDYFITFSECRRKKSVTPFLSFYLDGVISNIREIREQIVFSIRQLSLKDFLTFQRREKQLTQRQHDLLQILLETFEPFTLGDLFSSPTLKPLYQNVSEATARRDIKKLLQNAHILEKEKGKFSLNFRLLG